MVSCTPTTKAAVSPGWSLCLNGHVHRRCWGHRKALWSRANSKGYETAGWWPPLWSEVTHAHTHAEKHTHTYTHIQAYIYTHNLSAEGFEMTVMNDAATMICDAQSQGLEKRPVCLSHTHTLRLHPSPWTPQCHFLLSNCDTSDETPSHPGYVDKVKPLKT